MKKLLLNLTSFGEEEKLMSKKKKKINVEDETAITIPSMCLQLMNILSHFYPYFKFHLSFEYVKNKVSFEI